MKKIVSLVIPTVLGCAFGVFGFASGNQSVSLLLDSNSSSTAGVNLSINNRTFKVTQSDKTKNLGDDFLIDPSGKTTGAAKSAKLTYNGVSAVLPFYAPDMGPNYNKAGFNYVLYVTSMPGVGGYFDCGGFVAAGGIGGYRASKCYHLSGGRGWYSVAISSSTSI
jgi:hypothetical protein